MTASKHTPGPWVSVSAEGGWDGVAEAANRNSTICTLSLNNPENARLLAAAPELLEALTAAVAAIDKGGLDDAMCCDGRHCGCRAATIGERLAHDLRDVIAKATGETP